MIRLEAFGMVLYGGLYRYEMNIQCCETLLGVVFREVIRDEGWLIGGLARTADETGRQERMKWAAA